MKIKSKIFEEYTKLLDEEKRKKKKITPSKRFSKKESSLSIKSGGGKECDDISLSSPDFREKIDQCLLYTSQTFSEDEIRSSTSNIRLFLSELEFVAKGGNGFVFSSKTSLGKKIIVKFDDSPHQDFHEALIGLRGTNSLRKKIPNFAMILGTVECSFSEEEISKIDSHRDPSEKIEWCLHSSSEEENREMKKIFFYEYIPGETLELFLYKKLYFLSKEEIMNIFLQIIFSLLVAADDCNFTHYDLNLKNIIVRELDEKVKISYSSKSFSEPITIETSFIPTFIDYSFSNVNGLGEEKKSYFIFPEENIFADIFKVLSRSLEECYTSSLFSKGDAHFFAVIYLSRLIHLFLPIEDVLIGLDVDDYTPLKEFFYFSRKITNLPRIFTEEVSRKKFISLIRKKFLPHSKTDEKILDWKEIVIRKNKESIPIGVNSLNTSLLVNPQLQPYFSAEVDINSLIENTLIYVNILIGKIEEYQIYNQHNPENINSFFVTENIHCIDETLDFVIRSQKEIELLLIFTDFTNELFNGLVNRYNKSILFIERFRKILSKIISKRTLSKHSDFFSYKFKYF